VAPTKPTRRRRMSASARREQVLDVATEIVVEDGFHAISIQSVAVRAGITRPIIYEHFGGLQGLLEALVSRETTRALEQVESTALPDLKTGDPAELMVGSLAKYLSAVVEQPSTWRLVLMPPEGAPASLRRHIASGRERVLSGLTAAVGPGSLPGEFAHDPELTARILSAMADEYARLVLNEPERFPPQRSLEHARRWLDRLTS
jgi:AcrR family transcriptional regulator